MAEKGGHFKWVDLMLVDAINEFQVAKSKAQNISIVPTNGLDQPHSISIPIKWAGWKISHHALKHAAGMINRSERILE